MMRVELTLKTVTPLFLGGADQQPELRPASVRGALRFWLRAALGGVIGDADLDRLHYLEANVFGEMERGSAVVVRLSYSGFSKSEEPLLPHRTGGQAGIVKAVPVGTPFNLILNLRPCAGSQLLEIATWTALLWLTLGGIGRRSRRGAGSVRIQAVVTVPDEFSDDLKRCLNAATTTATDGQVLANRVGDLLVKARQVFTTFAPTTSLLFSSGLPSFSILPSNTRVVVWTPPNTDLNNYKTVLMPLMENMSSLASLGSSFGDAFGGINPRRSSPLHVTAHRLEQEWALTLTYLKAEIQCGDNGKPAEVTKFLNSLRPKWEISPRAAQDGNTS
jgi:CRISPR-associated protein Cmr1